MEKFGCRVRMRDLGVKEQMIEAMTDSAFKTMGGCLNCSLKPLRAAMETYLAGIDIGTSGAKGMVFDLAGTALGAG